MVSVEVSILDVVLFRVTIEEDPDACDGRECLRARVRVIVRDVTTLQLVLNITSLHRQLADS